MDLDSNLFFTPESNYRASDAKANPGITSSVEHSFLIERPSTTTKKPVKYVRLSDEDHGLLRHYVGVLLENAKESEMARLLAQSSGIYGTHIQKWSSYEELLHGVAEKLNKPHKYVRDRKGEDLSVKQLTAINTLLAELDVDPIAIPTA